MAVQRRRSMEIHATDYGSTELVFQCGVFPSAVTTAGYLCLSALVVCYGQESHIADGFWLEAEWSTRDIAAYSV